MESAGGFLASMISRSPLRRKRRLLSLLLIAAALLSVRTAAATQPFDATNLRRPTDLAGTWLIHAGDDPAFARTDFDDSNWTRFDPSTSITTIFPQSQPGVIWYRQKVKVSPTDSGLALREWNISRAFEVYVNGERLIASGQVSPYKPYTLGARLLARIPGSMVATGALEIAVRVHLSQIDWAGQDPGFFAANLTLGEQSTLEAEDWLTVIGENAFGWLDWSLQIGLGIVALMLFLSQRSQKEYLWIFALGLIRLAECPEPVIASFQNIPLLWEVLKDLIRVATPYILASLYFAFVHQKIGWRWRTFLVFAGVMNAVSSLENVILVVPPQFQLVSNLPFVVFLCIVIPVVLAIHLRRGNREAGILLIPALLFSLYLYTEIGLLTLYQVHAWRTVALKGLNLIDRFPAGPFAISFETVCDILGTVALAIIMLMRFIRMSRRQALLESELAAAQQVQQLLVPEKIEGVAGFQVESIYQPAQEVGGDFFQILPAGDGGLLVVVGDVAGKGLPAAMLVSMLVGAIRAIAEFTRDPAELLAHLNERLVGRAGGGFSTALIAHIAKDGHVTVANAGHLSPYLEGREVELAGALPLGIASGTRYQTARFSLHPGERLTFYSDGVVEAQNGHGELFGFERAREVSMQPAASIVKAAKDFGQQDDITVVAITRVSAVASAA